MTSKFDNLRLFKKHDSKSFNLNDDRAWGKWWGGFAKFYQDSVKARDVRSLSRCYLQLRRFADLLAAEDDAKQHQAIRRQFADSTRRAQFDLAYQLCEAVWRARKQANRTTDKIEEAFFLRFTPEQKDLYHYFRHSNARPAEPPVSLSVMLRLTDESVGALLRLEVELIPDRAGAIYQDICHPGNDELGRPYQPFRELGADFRTAYEDAWQRVKKELTLDQCDARFRLLERYKFSCNSDER